LDLHPIVRRFAYDRLATRDPANAHARLRAYRGQCAESVTVLLTAVGMFEKQKQVQAQRMTRASRALRELLRMRSEISNPKSEISDLKIRPRPRPPRTGTGG